MPAIAVLYYGIAKAQGDWRSEPLWTAVLTGAASVLVAVVVEFPLAALIKLVALSPAASAGLEALFVAAIPEETIKFLVVVGVCLKSVDVRREQDTILLALSVSLGFAALENLFYIAEGGNWAAHALVRAVTAVPGHGLDGLAMGAMLTMARLAEGRRPLHFAYALAVPVCLHAAYDFPVLLADSQGVFFRSSLVWSWVAVLIVSAICVVALCNRAFAAAAAADAPLKTDFRPPRAGRQIMFAGGSVVVAALALALCVYLSNTTYNLRICATISILPIILGVDLLRTGFRQHTTGEVNSKRWLSSRV